MAEVLLRDRITAAGLAGLVSVESAGTGDWHLGGPMSEGSEIELGCRGLDGSKHVARQITPSWLAEFDLLLAMDRGNLQSLQRMAAGRQDLADRIRMFRSFDAAARAEAEVPDPYGRPQREYARTYDVIEPAAVGLVAALEQVLAGGPAR
jgi:protein-tyrosine phosphatase